MKKILAAVLAALFLFSSAMAFAEEELTHFTGKVGFSIDYPEDLFRVEASGINTTVVALADDDFMNITILPSSEVAEDPVAELLAYAKEYGEEKTEADVRKLETASGAKVWALRFGSVDSIIDAYYLQDGDREFTVDVWARADVWDKYADAAEKVVLSFVNEPDGDMSGYQEESEFDFEPEYGDLMVEEYYDILQEYGNAVINDWDMETLSEKGMSLLIALLGDEAEDIQIAFESLNDGADEQMILYTDEEDGNNTLIAVIQKDENGDYHSCAISGERDIYTLCTDEDFAYYLREDGSNSASQSGTFIWKLDDAGQMEFVEGVVYDSDVNPDSPYFIVKDNTWELSAATPCTEAEAEALLAKYTPVQDLDPLLDLGTLVDSFMTEETDQGNS